MPERGEKIANESLPSSDISDTLANLNLEDENVDLFEEEIEEVVEAGAEAIPPTVQVVEHPLPSTWVLWYYLNDKHLKWEENQQEVGQFKTIEQFWSLMSHIENPSGMKVGCDYSLFKQGIRPMWEDPANINGGRWSLSLQKHQRQYDLDPLWTSMCIMVTGEDAEEDINKDICGIVVSVRNRGDRLALWTATSQKKELAYRVGRRLKEFIELSPNQILEYNLHSDTSTKRSSTVRALYTV